MPTSDFDGIINNFKKIAGVKSQKDLAEVLGISPQAVTEAKNRGVVPDRWGDVIVERFHIEKSQLFETPEEHLARTYGRNPATSSVGVKWGNETPLENNGAATGITQAATHEDFDMPDMVKMTMIVLGSDTVYKPALASNIRAFHKAVTMEGEMNELKNDVKEIKQQNADLRADIKALTEALLGAGIVMAKRDTGS